MRTTRSPEHRPASFRSLRAALWAVCTLLLATEGAFAEPPKPVAIGLDAEFGLADSTSAQAIERGIRIAIDEINRAGGVLGGRPLSLVTTDNRSVTARGIRNLQKLAEIPDLAAVFVGRFSPVVIECVSVAYDLKLILLDPWASADRIVDNGLNPNYVFRLALRDSVAMPILLRYAQRKGAQRVGLLVPNTAWGRSAIEAVQQYYLHNPSPRTVATAWYNWGDPSIIERYQTLRLAGAEAIVFVANDAEAVFLAREMASLPKDERLPVISHWGVTGGRFADLVGPDLDQIDLSVIQAFSFFRADTAAVDRILSEANRLFGISRIEQIESPVGLAQAYDLTHILARAINLAGTTNRERIRDALERVENHRGLIKVFSRPFSPIDHEALDPEDVFVAHYARDGTIRPIEHED